MYNAKLESMGYIRMDESVPGLVERNTKGNLLPGSTEQMTLKEAVTSGQFNTFGGTMSFSVTLIDADDYEPRVWSTVALIEGVGCGILKREWE